MLYITTALKRIASVNKKLVVVQGGARAGKTMAILMLIVDYCIKHENRTVGIFSHSYPHLKRGAIDDFIKICKEVGVYRTFAFNKQEKIFNFPNETKVYFITADTIADIQGMQFDITFINEARYVKFDFFNQVLSRTMARCYVDFNPTQRFYIHDVVAMRPDADFIKLTYKDNEACPKAIKEELEYIDTIAHTSSYWSNYARIFVHGEIGGSIDAVFPDWKSIKEIPSTAKLVSVGVDFGFTNDVTAIVAIYYNDDSYIIDEVAYKTRMFTDAIAETLSGYKCNIYCDNAEPRTIAELQRLLKSQRVQGVKFGISESIDIINRLNVFVTYKSTNIQVEQQNYVYKRDKYTGELTNEPIGTNNHAMDAIRYGLCGYLTKKYVYQKNF